MHTVYMRLQRHSNTWVNTCGLCDGYHDDGWEYTWGQMVTSTYHPRRITHSSSSPSVTAEHWPGLYFPLLTVQLLHELNHRKPKSRHLSLKDVFFGITITTEEFVFPVLCLHQHSCKTHAYSAEWFLYKPVLKFVFHMGKCVRGGFLR